MPSPSPRNTCAELEDRFPNVLEEIPPAPVEYVADLVKVQATDFAKHTLVCRTTEYHRKQIPDALGFWPSTVADEKAPAEWPWRSVRPSRWRPAARGPAGRMPDPEDPAPPGRLRSLVASDVPKGARHH